MLFTKKQIQECLDIIDFQHLFFVANNVSTHVLSFEDVTTLLNHGIDINKLKTRFSPFQQAYYFGRLASVLRGQAGKVNYVDFKKYLQRGQFIPLTSVEQKTLRYLENKTFHHIKGLTERVKEKVEGVFDTVNSRQEYEEIIKDALKGTVGKGNSVSDVMLEIGNKTQDWKRDLGRIAETELQNAFQHGAFMDYVERHGEDGTLLYKEVFAGACKHCIRVYLTNGLGSEPILFTAKELMENGDNIGLKAENWRATIGPVHPFCRCQLFVKEKDKVWNEDKKDFTWDKKKILDESRSIAGKIKITVGDQVIEV